MRTILILLLIPTLLCAQTKEDVLKELKRQNVPHAKIVLAQARLESGNFKSDFYKRTYNMFAMKKNGKYARYKHWRDAIRDYKKRISSRYDRTRHANYYAFLREMNYAEDPHYNDKLREIVD